MLAHLLLLAIALRPPVPSDLHCVSRDGKVHAVSQSAIQWQPAGKDDVLSCNAPGYEPLDISDPNSSVEFLPARNIKVLIATPSKMTVEWRVDDSRLHVSTLLARRQFEPADAIPLLVAPKERIARFHSGDYSPISRVIGPKAADPIKINPRLPGGEAYVTLPAKAFPEPSSVHFSREGTPIVAKADRRHYISPGMPARTYKVDAVYSGGVHIRSGELKILPSETSELELQLPPVGGVSVVAPSDDCRQYDGMNLVIVRPEGVVHSVALAAPPCAWTIDGLTEGQYVAEIRNRRDAVLAKASFTITAGTRVTTFVAPYDVRVTGQLLRGSTPVAKAILDFSSTAGSAEPAQVTTDAGGNFTLELPRAGRYSIAMMATPYLRGARWERDLTAGEQHVDLQLPLGRIQVRIRDSKPQPDGFAQLVITGPRSVMGPAAVNDAVELLGLELGTYALTASRQGARSEPVKVELTENDPDADVELELKEATGRVILSSPGAEPVSGAVIESSRQVRPIAPGTYDVSNVPPGSHMRIRVPSFTPMCVRRTAEEAQRVTVLPLSVHAMRVLGANCVLPEAPFLFPPGSDCPIPLNAFAVAREGDSTIVSQLPLGTYRFVCGGRSVTATVPGPAVTLPAPVK